MPLLLARIRDAADAAICRDAGLDGILAPTPDIAMREAAGFAAAGWVEPMPGGDVMILAEGDERHLLPLWTDRWPGELDLDRLATTGRAGVVLHSARRLVDALPAATMAGVVAGARSRGLRCVAAGGLEPPDLPRLAALGLDAMVLGRSLREQARAAGRLLPERVAMVRRVVPAGASAETRGPVVARTPDRIFVRDLVLPVAIGAYDSERGRRQRVRFSVEVELAGGGAPARSMDDIVSYDLITDAIHRLTVTGHVDFVETLAEEIATALLHVSRIMAVRVRVEKLDLGPEAVGIEIVRARA